MSSMIRIKDFCTLAYRMSPANDTLPKQAFKLKRGVNKKPFAWHFHTRQFQNPE